MNKLVAVIVAFALLWVVPPARADSFTLDAPIPGRAVRGFDEVDRYAAGHRGVDLRGELGETVRAAAQGRVFFAGSVAGVPTVSVDHGNGWRTTYQPVAARVAKGDAVSAGDALGTLAAGHCELPCLHWGLTDGVDYRDPLAYAAVPEVRLLPRGSEPATPPPLPAARVPAQSGLPVAGRISSPFGMRVHPVTRIYKLHDGVDIAAPCGTHIRAFGDGVVTRVGWDGAYGYRVFVDHGDGLVTAYAHLPGSSVRVGQRVTAGASVGVVGSTGYSTGCHLHWMAWRDGALIDPLRLLP